MSHPGHSQIAPVRPIRALVIKPDETHEVREIDQDLGTWQGIVGGYVEDKPTEHAVLWRDEEGGLKGSLRNMLATFLWWKLDPRVAERDVLCGTVFVTGTAEGEHALSVPDEVIDLFERVRAIYFEHKEG